jgi:hypothetical protein
MLECTQKRDPKTIELLLLMFPPHENNRRRELQVIHNLLFKGNSIEFFVEMKWPRVEKLKVGIAEASWKGKNSLFCCRNLFKVNS